MFSRLFGGETKKKKNEIDKYSLPHFTAQLSKLQSYVSVTESNTDEIVSLLVVITELMLYGDKHNPGFFDVFADKQILKTLMFLLESSKNYQPHRNNIQVSTPGQHGVLNNDDGSTIKNPTTPIPTSTTITTTPPPSNYVANDDYSNHNTQLQRQIIQSMSMLLQNTRNKMSTFYFLSNNLVNELIAFPYDLDNEDVISTYISFVKTLSNTIDADTLHFLFNADAHDFPLLVTPLRWHATSESLIRNFVRTIVLNIYNCQDKQLFSYLGSHITPIYTSNVLWYVHFQLRTINKWLNNIHFKYNLLLFNATNNGPMKRLFWSTDNINNNNGNNTPPTPQFLQNSKNHFNQQALAKVNSYLTQEDTTPFRLDELNEQIIDTILFLLDFLRSTAITNPIILPESFIQQMIKVPNSRYSHTKPSPRPPTSSPSAKTTEKIERNGDVITKTVRTTTIMGADEMSLDDKTRILLPITHYLKHLYITTVSNPSGSPNPPKELAGEKKQGVDNDQKEGDFNNLNDNDKKSQDNLTKNGIYLSDIILEQFFHHLILPLLTSLTLYAPSASNNSTTNKKRAQIVTSNDLPQVQYIAQSLNYPVGLYKTAPTTIFSHIINYQFLLYFLTQVFITFSNAISPSYHSNLAKLQDAAAKSTSAKFKASSTTSTRGIIAEHVNSNASNASNVSNDGNNNNNPIQLSQLDPVDRGLSRLLDTLVVLLFGIRRDFTDVAGIVPDDGVMTQDNDGDEEKKNIGDDGDNDDDDNDDNNHDDDNTVFFHDLTSPRAVSDAEHPTLPFYVTTESVKNDGSPQQNEQNGFNNNNNNNNNTKSTNESNSNTIHITSKLALHSLTTVDFILSQHTATPFPSTLDPIVNHDLIMACKGGNNSAEFANFTKKVQNGVQNDKNNKNTLNLHFHDISTAPTPSTFYRTLSKTLPSSFPSGMFTPPEAITSITGDNNNNNNQNNNNNSNNNDITITSPDQNMNPRAQLPLPSQYNFPLLNYLTTTNSTTTGQLRHPHYQSYRSPLLSNPQLHQNPAHLHSLIVLAFVLQNTYKNDQLKAQMGIIPFKSPTFGPFHHEDQHLYNKSIFFTNNNVPPNASTASHHNSPDISAAAALAHPSMVSLTPIPTIKSTQFDEIYIFNDLSLISTQSYPLIAFDDIPNQFSDRSNKVGVKGADAIDIALDIPSDLINAAPITPATPSSSSSSSHHPSPQFSSQPHHHSTIISQPLTNTMATTTATRPNIVFHYNALPSPNTYTRFLSLFTQIHPSLTARHINAHIIPTLITRLSSLARSTTAPPPLFSTLLLLLQLTKSIYIQPDIMSRAHAMFAQVRTHHYMGRDSLSQTAKIHFSSTFHTTRVDIDVIYDVYRAVQHVLLNIMRLIGVAVRKKVRAEHVMGPEVVKRINNLVPLTTSNNTSTNNTSTPASSNVSGSVSGQEQIQGQEEQGQKYLHPVATEVEIAFESPLSPLLWFKTLNLISTTTSQLLHWLLPVQPAAPLQRQAQGGSQTQQPQQQRQSSTNISSQILSPTTPNNASTPNNNSSGAGVVTYGALERDSLNNDVWEAPIIYPPILFFSNPVSLLNNIISSTAHLLYPASSTPFSPAPVSGFFQPLGNGDLIINRDNNKNLTNSSSSSSLIETNSLPSPPIEISQHLNFTQLQSLYMRLHRGTQQTPLHSRPPTSYIFSPSLEPVIYSPKGSKPHSVYSSPYTEQLFTMINNFASLYMLFFLLHSPHILAATRYNKLDLKVYLYDHFYDILGNNLRAKETGLPKFSQNGQNGQKCQTPNPPNVQKTSSNPQNTPKQSLRNTITAPLLPLLPSMALPSPVLVGNVIRVLNRGHTAPGSHHSTVVPHDSYTPSTPLAIFPQSQTSQRVELPPVYDVTICTASNQSMSSSSAHNPVRLNVAKDTSIPALAPNHPHPFAISTTLLSDTTTTETTTQQTLSSIQRQYGSNSGTQLNQKEDKRKTKSDPKKPSPDEILTTVTTTATTTSTDSLEIHPSVSVPQFSSLQPFVGEHGFIPNPTAIQTQQQSSSNSQRDILTVTKCGRYLIVARPLLSQQQQMETNQRQQAAVRNNPLATPVQTSSPCKLLFIIPTMNCYAVPYDCIYPTKYMYTRLSEYYPGERDLHIQSWSTSSNYKKNNDNNTNNMNNMNNNNNNNNNNSSSKPSTPTSSLSKSFNHPLITDSPFPPTEPSKFSTLANMGLILKDDYPLLPTDICLIITSPHKPHPSAVQIDPISISKDAEQTFLQQPVPTQAPPSSSGGVTSPPGFAIMSTTTTTTTKLFYGGILPDLLSSDFFSSTSATTYLSNTPRSLDQNHADQVLLQRSEHKMTGLEHVNYDYSGSPCAFTQSYHANHTQTSLLSSTTPSFRPGSGPKSGATPILTNTLPNVAPASFTLGNPSINNNSTTSATLTTTAINSTNPPNQPNIPGFGTQNSIAPAPPADQPIYNNKILTALLERYNNTQGMEKISIAKQIALAQHNLNNPNSQSIDSFSIAHYNMPRVPVQGEGLLQFSSQLTSPQNALLTTQQGSLSQQSQQQQQQPLPPSSQPQQPPIPSTEDPTVPSTHLHHHALAQDLIATATINNMGQQLLYPASPAILTASPHHSTPTVQPAFQQHLIPLSPTQQINQLWALPLRCPSGLVAGKVITMVNDSHRHAVREWGVAMGAIFAQNVLENAENLPWSNSDHTTPGNDLYSLTRDGSQNTAGGDMIYDFDADISNYTQEMEDKVVENQRIEEAKNLEKIHFENLEKIRIEKENEEKAMKIAKDNEEAQRVALLPSIIGLPSSTSSLSSPKHRDAADEMLDDASLALKSELEEEMRQVEANDRQSKQSSRRNSHSPSTSSTANTESTSSTTIAPSSSISSTTTSSPTPSQKAEDLLGDPLRIKALELRVNKEKMEESQHVDILLKKQQSLINDKNTDPFAQYDDIQPKKEKRVVIESAAMEKAREIAKQKEELQQKEENSTLNVNEQKEENSTQAKIQNEQDQESSPQIAQNAQEQKLQQSTLSPTSDEPPSVIDLITPESITVPVIDDEVVVKTPSIEAVGESVSVVGEDSSQQLEVEAPIIDESSQQVEAPIIGDSSKQAEAPVIVEEPTAIIEESTPVIAEEPTPIIEESSPVIAEGSTHVPEDPVVTEEPTSITEEVTPIVEEVTPVIEPTEETTPAVEEAVPVEQTTPVVEEAVPVDTPAVEEAVSVETPAVEEAVSVETPEVTKPTNPTTTTPDDEATAPQQDDDNDDNAEGETGPETKGKKKKVKVIKKVIKKTGAKK